MDAQIEKKIITESASKLVEWQKTYGVMQLRLRCAEIVWVNGSQEHKDDLEEHAGRIFKFVTNESGK